MPQSSHVLNTATPTREALHDALCRAITTTFEEMVFMEVTRTEEQHLSTQVYSRLDVHKPVACVFTLELSEGLVDACIEALYCGTETSDAVRQDLANELTNTIAGLLMSNMDESTPIALGLPSGARVAHQPESVRPVVQTYHTDVGPLRATVVV